MITHSREVNESLDSALDIKQGPDMQHDAICAKFRDMQNDSIFIRDARRSGTGIKHTYTCRNNKTLHSEGGGKVIWGPSMAFSTAEVLGVCVWLSTVLLCVSEILHHQKS